MSLGENRQLIQNGVAKWEKPPRGFGTVKMKFRKENHQMLPLTIIRKKKHRDELFSIFINGKMKKVTDRQMDEVPF